MRATFLLAALGSVFGALLGTLVLFLAVHANPDGATWTLDLAFAGVIGGGVGALVGAVGAPLLGWSLLRFVPLGRALLGTSLGTLLGAALWFPAHPLLGGMAGCVLSAGLLGALARRASAREASSNDAEAAT